METDNVIKINLCEVPHLVLNKGQKYCFVIVPGCHACKKALDEAINLYVHVYIKEIKENKA